MGGIVGEHSWIRKTSSEKIKVLFKFSHKVGDKHHTLILTKY